MAEFKYGWNRDSEDWDYLKTPTARSFAAPAGFTPPESMSYRNILTVEDQLSLSSCVGHGGSSGMENLQFLSNGGKVPMSRMGCYLLAQRKSGIRTDDGATISGCVQALREWGCPLESEFPYTGQYSYNIPKSVIEAAGKHKILGHQELNSYQEVFDWISQAKGPVIIGMSWYINVADGKGRIRASDLRGRSYGGHCIVMAGYSGAVDSKGKKIIDALNSHGLESGIKGWFEWESDAVEELCRQERGTSSVIGITNITGFDPARVDRVKDWREVI